MSILSRDDEQGFLNAIAAAGLRPYRSMDWVSDGKLQRYRVDGDKSGSKNGWYVLYTDGAVPAGAFGSWKTGESVNWCSKSENLLSSLEREEWRQKQLEAKRAREAEQVQVYKEAAVASADLWAKGKPAAVGCHPYLAAKGVKPYGLKVMNKLLLVPLRNASGAVTSMQFIQVDGKKRFKTGGQVSGQKLDGFRDSGCL